VGKDVIQESNMTPFRVTSGSSGKLWIEDDDDAALCTYVLAFKAIVINDNRTFLFVIEYRDTN
jgi:hypothetical protein